MSPGELKLEIANANELQPRSNPHATRAFAMIVVKSSSLEETAVIPEARASFSMSTLLSVVSTKIGNAGSRALN
jgi:hypothetical protein